MDVEAEALKILHDNRRSTGEHQYTVPSADHYPYQWLWDSCFHAIILARYEPDAAKKELLSLIAKQFKNGLIPHIIYWSPGILYLFNWGVEGTSSITQPPMLAYAAWEIHRREPDISFLNTIYQPLVAFHRFLLTERDPRRHHLASIINPDESGEDNSPRFDAPLNCPVNITLKDHLARRLELVDLNKRFNFDEKLMRDHFWVKDVLFNSVLVENMRALARIARALEKHEDASSYELQADGIAAAMRERMFEDGVYYSTSGADFTKLKVVTWGHFAPLFAGLYTNTEAAALIRHYFNDEATFAAPWGIRTTSKSEPAYRAAAGNDFSWRGPIWIGAHWFIYRGLVRYGFMKEARHIADKSQELIEVSGFRECFDPETGEGYGARNFTWGTLVLDMTDHSGDVVHSQA